MEYVSQNSGSGRQTVMLYFCRLETEFLSRKLLKENQGPHRDFILLEIIFDKFSLMCYRLKMTRSHG